MNFLFGFSGRIGRGGWWLGQLAILVVIGVGIGLLMAIASTGELHGQSSADVFNTAGTSVLVVLGCIVILMSWINLATTVKRFHDRDKSGLWFLMSFVPIIGGIWILVECGMLPGTPGGNDYGPSNDSGGYGLADDLDLGGDYGSSRVAAPESPRATRSAASQISRPRTTGPAKFGRRV